MYNDVPNNRKVQSLPDKLFKGWVNLLCVANANGGCLPPTEDVAYALRITVQRAEFFIDELVKARLFEWKNGVAYPHNWEQRQFKSDVSTDRVKRFREKHGNGERNVSETATVTHPEQNRTEQIQKQNRTDTELETLLAEFPARWARYPAKDGRIEAEKAWKRSVRTPVDLQNFDKAFTNYLQHLAVSGYKAKNGKTFFNNWHDFIDWQEPSAPRNPKDTVPPFVQPVIDEAECAEEIKRLRTHA